MRRDLLNGCGGGPAFAARPRHLGYTPGVKLKVAWLPQEVLPGQPTEVCPRCGAKKMFAWTLRRDPERMTLLRTWVCAACQATEEREESE